MMSRYVSQVETIIQELTQEEAAEMLLSVSSLPSSSCSRAVKEKVKADNPCSVCGDKATGSHYRALTCEGCKGFFRRTIQKKTTYTCEWNGDCVIDKLTRTQCQKCRFDKCIAVGMTPHTVLSDRQRAAKRQQREENRLSRNQNNHQNSETDVVPHNYDGLQLLIPEQSSATQLLKTLVTIDPVGPILQAYRSTFTRVDFSENTAQSLHTKESGCLAAVYVADMLTLTISKVIQFAKAFPGFATLTIGDQITLLQASCLEVLCLRSCLRYDAQRQGFPLRQQGSLLTLSDLAAHPELDLLSPLFNYAVRIQKLALSEAEVSLLATAWILQSSRPDLTEPERVEALQDSVIAMALRLYGSSGDELRWFQALITRPPPLKGFTVARQPEKLAIYVSIEHVTELPISFVHLFEEHP